MGLVKCFECGNEVSEYAEKCPKCGCPIEIIKKNELSNINSNKSGVCMYQGKAYNLEEVEKLLNDNKIMEATKVINEKLGLIPLKASLFVRVIQFNNNKIPKNYEEAMEGYKNHNKETRELYAVHCPRCGSSNVEEMVYAPLPYIRREYWYCNNCHFEFEEH